MRRTTNVKVNANMSGINEKVIEKINKSLMEKEDEREVTKAVQIIDVRPCETDFLSQVICVDENQKEEALTINRPVSFGRSI